MAQNILLCDAVTANGREHEWTVYCVDLSKCFKTEKFLALLAFGKILYFSLGVIFYVDSSLYNTS